jgi:formylglycine-generating enzyme required for sulfatase activity
MCWIALAAVVVAGCDAVSQGESRVEPFREVRPWEADLAQSPANPPLAPPEPRSTNSIGMTMVWIPPGEFLMGSPRYEEGRDEDETQHKVRITKPWRLSAHEVTVGQFRCFVAETGYRTEAENRPRGEFIRMEKTNRLEFKTNCTWRDPGFPQTDAHPVVFVSWDDAAAFCRWLSRREGADYRLPTEAEWEYACRAATTTRFWAGNADTSWFQTAHLVRLIPNGRGGYDPGPMPRCYTAPVGSYEANPFGLYDTHGNVWEWCADWYDPQYYQRSPAEDPAGPCSGESRVRRGGGFETCGRYARSANRHGARPSHCSMATGFRAARSGEGTL